jgi:peptidoglycan/LPS O-acetylase OafA/YrhL
MALSATFGSGKVIQMIQSYRIVAVGVACLLLAPMFIFDFDDDRHLLLVWALGKIAVWLAAALLVAASLRVVSVSNPIVAGLARIGRASYSIYLWHQAVNHLGARGILLAAGSSSWWLYFGVYVAGSICFGLLMHEMLERPLLRLRDTWSRAG